MRMGLEVVVPDRLPGRASEGRRHRVGAIVLYPHQGGLAELASPGADPREHVDRAAAQVARLRTVARLVSLGLSTGPACRAWCVVAGQRHDQLPFLAAA